MSEVLNTHLLQPTTAYAYRANWQNYLASGRAIFDRVSYDGEQIRHFRIERAVVEDLVVHNNGEIHLVWGLNEDEKITPILIRTTYDNARNSGRSYDFAQPCPEICPNTPGGK